MRWTMRRLPIFLSIAASGLVVPETTRAADPPAASVTISFGLAAPAEAAPEASKQPTSHREASRVVLRDKKNSRNLQTFCIGPDGRLFGVVAKSFYDGAESAEGGEIRVLDASGKETATWTTKFTPQRIAAAPDGSIFIGGSGRLLQLTADGMSVAEVESPHLKVVLADKATLRKAAEEQHAENVRQYEDQLKSFDEQVKDLKERLKKEEESKKKPGDKDAKKNGDKNAEKPAAAASSIFGFFSSSGDDDSGSLKSQLEQFQQIQNSYKQMLDREKKKTLEDVEREIASRLQRIHGVAASADAVYVATAMSKGYGYAVWKMNRDFGDAKEIISGLSGCCGQIDIQCKGKELFVAENSRHRVVRYDADGKKLGAWGKRDRDGAAGGFGGCCNPMNLCFAGDGSLVTSESEGLMKRFSPDGKFAGLMCSAKVGGGCKNVAVAVSSDGKHAYFYDQDGSQIIVFDRIDSSEEPTEKPAKSTTIQ
jgi:hypothetical protein